MHESPKPAMLLADMGSERTLPYGDAVPRSADAGSLWHSVGYRGDMRPLCGCGWWRHRGRPQMASEPLQRDLPGVLGLCRVLEIEYMTSAGDHNQFDVTAQCGETRRQALGFVHGCGAILVAVY